MGVPRAGSILGTTFQGQCQQNKAEGCFVCKAGPTLTAKKGLAPAVGRSPPTTRIARLWPHRARPLLQNSLAHLCIELQGAIASLHPVAPFCLPLTWPHQELQQQTLRKTIDSTTVFWPCLMSFLPSCYVLRPTPPGASASSYIGKWCFTSGQPVLAWQPPRQRRPWKPFPHACQDWGPGFSLAFLFDIRKAAYWQFSTSWFSPS